MAGLVENIPVDAIFADRVIDQFLAAHRAATPATDAAN